MIKKPSNQLTIDSFMDATIGQLNPKNRWVNLAKMIPWAPLCSIYESKMNKRKGAPSKDARLVIGALLIKHKLKLSDQEAVEQIQENPYLQFFVGLPRFTYEKPFDSSLFTHIRKRFVTSDFNKMTQILQSFEIEINETGQTFTEENESEENTNQERNIIVVDATVAPQEIPYPTDHSLVATARVQSELIIDKLWFHIADKASGKPRTYRETARKAFVQAHKKRNKDKAFWLKVTDQQLRYLERNIRSIHRLLDSIEEGIPLNEKFLKLLYVIQEVARQQRQKIESDTNVIEHRIVNVFQPHVRPIKRGKDNADTEFGSKLSLSIDNGYTFLDKVSWENYYEGRDDIVEQHIDSYHQRNPKSKLDGLVGDKVYGNKKAREKMNNMDVEFIGTPLGRPPKDPGKIKQREKNQQVHQQLRSRVEGKIGQSKRGYGLDKIKAKRSDTSLTWIACILLVTNLERFWKGIFFDLIYLMIEYDLWEITDQEISHKCK